MGTPALESEGSDPHLQPLGTASFQASSFSVNSPTTIFSQENSLISNASSCNPNAEQEQSLAVLKDHHDSEIIAWHTLLQSTEPGLRHLDWPGGLSIEKINAISALRYCSREELLDGLKRGICSIKFPAHLFMADSISSKTKFFAKPWPLRLEILRGRLVTSDPTRIFQD